MTWIIKSKLTNNSLGDRYLINNVGWGITNALKIKEIKENKELRDKLDFHKKELYRLKEPSLNEPKTVNIDEQRLAHSIGLKVYRLIENYL